MNINSCSQEQESLNKEINFNILRVKLKTNNLLRKGEFVLSYGPMKSGKSETITSFIYLLEIAKGKGFKNNYSLFKPSVDRRDGPYIISRANSSKDPRKYPSVFIDIHKPESLLDYISQETHMVGIDELQFFDEGIVGVIEELLKKDIYVVGAGLDLDFRRKPFGAMPQLINIATESIAKKAICDKCGGIATLTQRLNKDRTPASFDEPVLAVEQISTSGQYKKQSPDYFYEARCFHCYEFPK